MSPPPSQRPDRGDAPPRARSLGARALLVPPALVLVLALVASVSIHLPIYAGLGALARFFESQPPPPVDSIEITLAPPSPSTIPSEAPEDPAPPSTEEPTEDTPELPPEPPRPPRPARRERPPPEAQAERPPPPEPPPLEVTPPRAAPPPPPPPRIDERRAIVQRSQDPNVEPPPDAQFIAEESQDVEEQTVASITSTVEDDPEPSLAPPSEPAPAPADQPGDSAEELQADMRDVEGDDRRRVTPEEAERRPRPTAEPDRSTSPTPTVSGAESLDPGADERARSGPRERSEEGGARAMGGGEAREEEIVVTDGFGTWTIRRPRADVVEGRGEGEAGGPRREGRGLGESGEGLASGRPGRTRGGAHRGGSEGRRGAPDLGLSWTQFEAIYGEEELRREREARLEQRRSRSRGASREQRWQEFRAALENYVSEVRPGNQTALDAAASPFARFLSDMHRRIHREFADRYLASIGLDATEGLNDMSLETTLEISVNPDGTIHRVGIVATSGNILYDFGAFNSVMRAQPFPAPPSAILSGDGRAWLHWRFERGPRQCGTWNARPFMLENAPLVDRGEPPEEGAGRE